MFFRGMNRYSTNRTNNFTNDLLIEDYIGGFTNTFRSNSASSIFSKRIKSGLDPKVSGLQHRLNTDDVYVNKKNKRFKRKCF